MCHLRSAEIALQVREKYIGFALKKEVSSKDRVDDWRDKAGRFVALASLKSSWRNIDVLSVSMSIKYNTEIWLVHETAWL